MLFKAITLLAGLASLTAFGESPKNYCTPLSNLSQPRNCGNNSEFTIAALACMKKLNAEITAQQGILAAAMQLANSLSASRQSEQNQDHISNLQAMKATLNGLLAKAKQARSEVESYQKNLAWPGHLPPNVISALKLDSLFSTFSCYSGNKKELQAHLALIDGRIQELNKAMAAAEGLEGRTSAHKDGLNSSSGTTIIRSGPGSATPIVVQPRNYRPSDISGTDDQKKK